MALTLDDFIQEKGLVLLEMSVGKSYPDNYPTYLDPQNSHVKYYSDTGTGILYDASFNPIFEDKSNDFGVTLSDLGFTPKTLRVDLRDRIPYHNDSLDAPLFNNKKIIGLVTALALWFGYAFAEQRGYLAYIKDSFRSETHYAEQFLSSEE